MTDTNNTQPTPESTGDVDIAINFLDGGFADFKRAIGYQIQSGVITIIIGEYGAEVFPLNTIQSISIAQSKE